MGGRAALLNIIPASTGAANTLQELIDDFTTLGNDLEDFYNNLVSYSIVSDEWENSLNFGFLDNSIDTAPQKRFFMIFGRDIVENKEGFIAKVTPGELGQNQKFVNYITTVVNGLQTDYQDSYNASQKYFQNWKMMVPLVEDTNVITRKIIIQDLLQKEMLRLDFPFRKSLKQIFQENGNLTSQDLIAAVIRL